MVLCGFSAEKGEVGVVIAEQSLCIWSFFPLQVTDLILDLGVFSADFFVLLREFVNYIFIGSVVSWQCFVLALFGCFVFGCIKKMLGWFFRIKSELDAVQRTIFWSVRGVGHSVVGYVLKVCLN